MGLFGFGDKKGAEAAPRPMAAATLSDGTSVQIAEVVDCIGDSCPRPQLMTKKAIGKVEPGEVVEVLVDNPSSVEALPPMCDEINATHLETVKGDRSWHVYIRKD
ncbi:tRNA 2-thiouridine synthesizing protein A [Rhodobium orientis]|uniref:UPF0033 domain-containing protein n=1 Tax=Rhodobium orientis TaxID=34017 RepID=A0A327JW69_9HYPH|nr:sulfurtransferase TusA family protein [Rhodobium orientis]MBB4302756.1 tRNA 2-thiouridine synthesizing protein A [Rhodobium orientis]MBK5948537.1 hypothetical protein [Rhodobium orientis]RAI29804.1 hypothetical protein CH339_01955 [Rhodobium orientis]